MGKGDGFCDDDNNNDKCGWDGGDCCGSENDYGQCDECKCKDCKYSSGDSARKSMYRILAFQLCVSMAKTSLHVRKKFHTSVFVVSIFELNTVLC